MLASTGKQRHRLWWCDFTLEYLEETFPRWVPAALFVEAWEARELEALAYSISTVPYVQWHDEALTSPVVIDHAAKYVTKQIFAAAFRPCDPSSGSLWKRGNSLLQNGWTSCSFLTLVGLVPNICLLTRALDRWTSRFTWQQLDGLIIQAFGAGKCTKGSSWKVKSLSPNTGNFLLH